MSDLAEKKEGEIVQASWEKYIYPGAELFGGIYKAYFSTYINLLAATVYVFSAQIVWVMELLEAGIQWIGAPVMGAVYDRFSFKNGKFWPWWIILGAGTGIVYLIFFSIPAFVPNPASFAVLGAILVAVGAFCASGSASLGVAQMMYMGKDEKVRSWMGMTSKFARDGMKMVVGFIFPVALIAFNKRMPETQSYALFTTLLVVVAVAGFIWIAALTKKSSIERYVLQSKLESRKKRPLINTIKAIFTNRAMLVMFLAMTASKMAFFWHIMGGAFFWRFYMGNFGMFAMWNLFIGLGAMFGVLLLPAFRKMFKDTKSAYLAAFALQGLCYLISIFVVSPSNPVGTIAIITAALFFNSIPDGLILPMFGIAAEYTALKSGERDYGLAMSIYSLSIRVGSVGGLSIRMALLMAAGFNTGRLAAGEAAPEAVMSVFKNYMTLWPCLLVAFIILIVAFLNPLNDAKAIQLRKDFDEKWGKK